MNLRGKLPLFCAVLLFLAGCAAPQLQTPTPSPVPAVAPRATSRPAATATRTPAPSPTPSSTALSPLHLAPRSLNGPHLAYIRAQQLALLDADGTGREIIPLPAGSDVGDYAISPDGRWLAYYLGSAQNDQPHNLSLNLLDLHNGQTRLVSKLLSRDYPQNFAQAVKKPKDPSTTTQQLQQAFLAGITHALAWSPDGSYLAFAGEMDGPSSDVYVYDMHTWGIQRKSFGPSEIQWLGWSPDGQWLVYSSVYAFDPGTVFEFYATTLAGSPPGSLVMRAPTNVLSSSATQSVAPSLWINAHQFLAYDSNSLAGDYDLRLVDIAAGSAVELWAGNFTGLTIDPHKQWAGFFSSIPGWPYGHIDGPDYPAGAYLVGFAGPMRVSVPAPHVAGTIGKISLLSGYIGDQQPFVASASNIDHLLFVSAHGTLSDSGIAPGTVSFTPDLQNWIVIGTTIRVYSAGNELVREVPLPAELHISQASQIVWRPDSSGLFLVSDASLYALDLHSGGVQLVETALDLPAAFTWVTPK